MRPNASGFSSSRQSANAAPSRVPPPRSRCDSSAPTWTCETSLRASAATLAGAACAGRSAASSRVSAPGFSASGSSATLTRTASRERRPTGCTSLRPRCRRSARLWSRNPSATVRVAIACTLPAPAGDAARSDHFRSPNDPATKPAVAPGRAGRAVRDRSSSTPPEALPYSADDAPRRISTRARSSSSTFVSCPWPSGRVCGMPSNTILTPRTPNAERAPNPRIATRWSSAGL